MQRLADGVYARILKFGGKAISNAGIIDNGKETFIFDTFLAPDVAEELVQAVEHLRLSPVKYVINCNSHNDQIRGNQVFSDEVKIIGTEMAKKSSLKHGSHWTMRNKSQMLQDDILIMILFINHSKF